MLGAEIAAPAAGEMTAQGATAEKVGSAPEDPPAAENGSPHASGNRPQSAAESAPGSSPSPFTEPQTAAWLARTLDALDRTLHQAPTAPPEAGEPAAAGLANAPAEAQAALTAAMQAQASALQSARAAESAMAALLGDTPGAPESEGPSPPGPGASVEAGPLAEGQLPGSRAMDNAVWGRLPPSQMRDLMEGRREVVSDEYRRMVEAYFRAVAEKAKGDQKR